MTQQRNDGARYRRYAEVLDAVSTRDAFTAVEVRETCATETPSFVTRVIHELEKDGFLERSGPKSKPMFRWLSDRENFSGADWLENKIGGQRMTCTPAGDRPRERLLAHGAAALRTAELIAILIRTGRPGESALQAGEKLANRFAECLEQLPLAGRGELKSISPAVQPTAYCQVMAGIELGRRVAEASGAERRSMKITGSTDAVEFCRSHFDRLARDAAQEEFHIATLTTKNEIITTHQITVGTLDASLVHPREVFRPAIKDAAATILLVHNHPSGDPTPSREDLEVTTKLEDVGVSVGIKVLDHIILGRNAAISIQEYRLKLESRL